MFVEAKRQQQKYDWRFYELWNNKNGMTCI